MTDQERRPGEKTFGPSDYLAAERTFLAWIRTGLALMGFGFVVARFGLFLHALRLGAGQASGPSFSLSLEFGTTLLVIGVVVEAVSVWSYLRLVRRLNDNLDYRRPSLAGIVVAAVLAIMGLVLAVDLILSQGLRHVT